jgi:hypothetical protein
MGKYPDSKQTIPVQFEVENEGTVIPTNVRWLANTRTNRQRRQNGEIAASSVVFVVNGSMVAQRVVKKGMKAADIWYRVKMHTTKPPHTRCELCCMWGCIVTKWDSKAKCGYCSGHYQTSDHKCDLVWCLTKEWSLCGHTLEKCPKCDGNYIPFSSRWVKKTEGTEAAWQSTNIGLGRWGYTSVAWDRATVTGSNRVALVPRPQGVVAGREDEDKEEMADMEEEGYAAEEARDIIMAEPETATRAASEIKTQTESGALDTND